MVPVVIYVVGPDLLFMVSYFFVDFCVEGGKVLMIWVCIAEVISLLDFVEDVLRDWFLFSIYVAFWYEFFVCFYYYVGYCFGELVNVVDDVVFYLVYFVVYVLCVVCP